MATKEKTKKEKKEKIKKTPKQKRRVALKVFLSIILIIALLAGILAVLNLVGVKSNAAFVRDNIEAVKYEKQLNPEKDDKGRYTFVTDEDFKVLQITDVHIGGGVMSSAKDSEALNAVAAMVTAEKPDLVVVTGDVAYPVPYQAGTFNNKESAKLFADLMEKLGVYWCLAFGNHDTELYSYYNREQICAMYESRDYPHCLMQAGDKDVDGYGNYVVNIKNSEGKITQSLFVFDSHSYVDGDYFGIQWKYDCVHKNQVDWYKKTVKELTDENGGEQPKSLAFFHIPPQEMRDAYKEYKDAGNKDTENVKYKYGKIAEGGEIICCSNYNYKIFDAFRTHGTQGVFFGHDHLNNMSLNYKGVQLTYGYSIDYLAYAGINKYGLQRGCTPITIKPDGTFEHTQENYYQSKYTPVKDKEPVDLEHEMADETGGVDNPFAEE
ncbi:MAG: metallophosphoesterase [Eubacterium sp.]|nr:metallophosphoesterase [Eubacterium sp.]